MAGIFGTPKEAIINTIFREKYVYERLLGNAEKLAVAEIEHAKRYYLRQLTEAARKGVEIKPEYIVKPIKK